MSERSGGNAFPETRYGGNTDRRPVDTTPGMTLRDYFAAQALTGCLANIDRSHANLPTNKELADEAYALADAMLAERGK